MAGCRIVNQGMLDAISEIQRMRVNTKRWLMSLFQV